MRATPQRNDAFLQQAMHAARVGLWDWDLRTNLVNYSTEWKRQLGYEEDEISNDLNAWESRVHPDDLPGLRQRRAEYLRHPWPDYEEEFRIQRKDHAWRWMLARAGLVLDEQGQPARIVGCHIDITRHKLVEIELGRVNRAQRLISGSNLTLIQLGDEETVLEKICRLAVEVGGYKMAWVGVAEQNERKTLRPAAQAGFAPGYLESVSITWADEPQGHGPAGTAVRTGRTTISRNIPADPAFEPWRDAVAQVGYQSVIAVPLRSEGSVFGTLVIYATEVDAFGPAEVRVLEELASDLAFGLMVIRTRAERDRAGEALKESERKLEEAQRLANIGYWERDIAADRITWSDETWRIWGAQSKRGALSQAELEQMIHPDDRQLQRDALAAVMKGCRRYDLEYRVVRPNGDIRFVHVRDDVVCDEAGRPVRIFGTVQDITERKQMENALRQSERQLRLVVDTVPTMTWIVLPDGALEFINQPWLNYSGLTLEEALKEPTRTIHPDDMAAAMEKWSVNMVSGEPYEHEMRLRRADGQYHWFLVRTVPLRDERGRIIRWYGTSTDIEDRKRAEEAVRESRQLLHLVLATLPVGVAVIDRAGGIVLTNAASKRIWGEMIVSGRERWAQSKGFWHDSGKRIAPADWASVWALSEGQTRLNELIDIESFDGQLKTIQNSCAPIRNAEGLIMGAVIVNEDVTERVRAGEALHQTQIELARVARLTMMGELAASIAHEVNQPLAGVVTNANASLRWLAAVPPNLDEAREGLRRIVRDGNRAGEVIARIRTLLKKGEPVRMPIKVNDVVREALALAQPELRRHKVLLQTELGSKLPRVNADSVQLQQVLLNLMVNALDSMSAAANRPRILRIWTDRPEPNTVRVAVQDTGIGADPQQSELLFQPFFTTKPHGLGMGLTISRSIIEAHGGRLWMTPNDGPGVTFQFALPVQNGATR